MLELPCASPPQLGCMPAATLCPLQLLRQVKQLARCAASRRQHGELCGATNRPWQGICADLGRLGTQIHGHERSVGAEAVAGAAALWQGTLMQTTVACHNTFSSFPSSQNSICACSMVSQPPACSYPATGGHCRRLAPVLPTRGAVPAEAAGAWCKSREEQHSARPNV
jgi:hypothetical protein